MQKPANEVLLLVSNGLATSDVQYAAHKPRADGNLNWVLTDLPSGVAPAKTPILLVTAQLAGALSVLRCLLLSDASEYESCVPKAAAQPSQGQSAYVENHLYALTALAISEEWTIVAALSVFFCSKAHHAGPIMQCHAP